MEIIELSSEPDTTNLATQQNLANEIIELSDEAHGSSQVQVEGFTKNGTDAEQCCNARANLPDNDFTDDIVIYDTQDTTTIAPESCPQKNILDLNNWISSSEDDSFARHIEAKKPKSPLQRPRRDSLLKKVLLSSPISEHVSQSHSDSGSMGTSKSLQDMSNLQGSSELALEPSRLKRAASKRVMESSDPIEGSDASFSSPKKKTTKHTSASAKTTANKAWREANKTIRRKNDLLKEMVIEISDCVKGKIQTPYFSEVFELPQVRTSYLDVPLISWKRRVKARYNKEQDIFVPCELTEICEKPLMLLYEPAELVQKIKHGTIHEDLEITRRKAQTEDPLVESYVVIIVYGIQDYLRKLQSLEDKQYRQNLLSQLNESQSRTKPTESLDITAHEASQIFIEAEMSLGINIFRTKSIEETIDWLHSFTYTIGSSLYDKFERNSGHTNFGNVRSGSDQKSTFLEMVKKFNLMTAPRAQHLYQYYGSVSSLFDRYQKRDNLGTINGKSIVPPTVNTSMMRVFTAEDCNMVITE